MIPFYFAHKTTRDLTCGHLGNRNVINYTWLQIPGGKPCKKNNDLGETHVYRLEFPAGFHRLGMASVMVLRKQKERHRDGRRHLGTRGPCRHYLGALSCPYPHHEPHLTNTVISAAFREGTPWLLFYSSWAKLLP